MLPLIFINNIKINNMENKQIKCYCGHTIYCDCSPLEEPKQETLEEAAENYAHNYFNMHETNNYKALRQGFDEGAKWQQERMYSEEEVLKLIDRAFHMYASSHRHDAKEWLVEQFKKK